MVNTRQRLSSSGHTRREFRQLQQQHRDREDGVQREPGKRGHRVKQVVDEHGVPYIMDNEKLNNLRSNINTLDDQILNLLRERAEIVTKIGEHKKGGYGRNQCLFQYIS